MRARYTAYTRHDQDFLLRSWHPDTRPAVVADAGVQWLGLEVRAACDGRALDRTGTVTFVARYRVGSRTAAMAEESRFVRVGTRWMYLEGKTAPA